MRRRKIFLIILIIIVTAGCIYLGYRTRYQNRLIVTQLAGEGNGYLVQTSKNNLIVIDGGTENDSVRLKQLIQEKGNSNVIAWFLTLPQSENSGALTKLINDTDITISNVYVSLNAKEWYENLRLEQTDLEEIENLIDVLYTDENRNKVIELQKRAQYKFDNLIITPLEIKDEQKLKNVTSNQNVILKLDNTFKNMIFLGNTGMEKGHYFRENNQDQFKCEGIQMSTNGLETANPEIFEEIKPKYVMISGDTIPEYIQSENMYTKVNGEITLEIW